MSFFDKGIYYNVIGLEAKWRKFNVQSITSEKVDESILDAKTQKRHPRKT